MFNMFSKKGVPVDCDNCNIYVVNDCIRISLMKGKTHIANIDCDMNELDELLILLESTGKILKNRELLNNIEE